jgi:hypothetical protein
MGNIQAQRKMMPDPHGPQCGFSDVFYLKLFKF